MSTMKVTDVKVVRMISFIFSFLMMLFLFLKKTGGFFVIANLLLNQCFCCFRHCYCHFHSHCLYISACDCLLMCACLCHFHCLCLFVGRVKLPHHSEHLSERTHISRSTLQFLLIKPNTEQLKRQKRRKDKKKKRQNLHFT